MLVFCPIYPEFFFGTRQVFCLRKKVLFKEISLLFVPFIPDKIRNEKLIINS